MFALRNIFTSIQLCALVISALPMPEIQPATNLQSIAASSTPPASASAESFYDDNLEIYVDRIAEQIVNFNLKHEPQNNEKTHEKIAQNGKIHEKHSKHHQQHQHQNHHHDHHGHHATQQHDAYDAHGDGDEMQSDQPVPGQQQQGVQTVQQGEGSQQEQLLRQRAQDDQRPEDRDKLAMTNNIKEKVMLFITKGNGSKSYGERDRSFYANCDQAKSSEETDDLMKLYFTISQLEDTIAAANLRLHRKNPLNYSQDSQADPNDAFPCFPTAGNRGENGESEKLYRVTLYYHVKGQKKHKSKRKIGDSRVITDSTPYVNLNVLHGVRELNKGKLFGVMVQVEDQFGTIVKATDFFKGPTCTVGMPTPQPLPTIFEETYTNPGRTAQPADHVRKPLQPKLDIKTIQAPPEDDPTAANRCRHVQLRHTHGHHQQRTRMQPPPASPGTVIVSKAGSNLKNVDMDELKLLLNRMQLSNARQGPVDDDFST